MSRHEPTPEFCASCHKSVAPSALNGYKFIRGFSVYDEWQQSGASAETVSPFYRKPKQVDCRSCHMPSADATEDRSAKEGVIASHRWPGANSITPLFYGQKRQVEVTTEFLRDKVRQGCSRPRDSNRRAHRRAADLRQRGKRYSSPDCLRRAWV